MEVPEFLWHCSRDSEIIIFFILEVSLSLTWCQRNARNYRQNDELLETWLRLIWRFSESVSEYESVFRICVWIIIHVQNPWFRTIWIEFFASYDFLYGKFWFNNLQKTQSIWFKIWDLVWITQSPQATNWNQPPI